MAIYSCTFLYNASTLHGHIILFLRNGLQCAVLANAAGSHSNQLMAHFESGFIVTRNYYDKCDALISTITLLTRKRAGTGIRRLVLKVGKYPISMLPRQSLQALKRFCSKTLCCENFSRNSAPVAKRNFL